MACALRLTGSAKCKLPEVNRGLKGGGAAEQSSTIWETEKTSFLLYKRKYLLTSKKEMQFTCFYRRFIIMSVKLQVKFAANQKTGGLQL
jgi:hypothetical protein